tara:strand:- start:182 stop:436 length:255 start_codon:yes stop_codon:yes gene_type:complete
MLITEILIGIIVTPVILKTKLFESSGFESFDRIAVICGRFEAISISIPLIVFIGHFTLNAVAPSVSFIIKHQYLTDYTLPLVQD